MHVLPKILALSCSAAFCSGLVTFAPNSPAKSGEVNQNFQYLDTSKAGKTDVELIKSALGGKAALGAVTDLSARHDSLVGAAKNYADQSSAAKALSAKADTGSVAKALSGKADLDLVAKSLRDSTMALRNVIANLPSPSTGADTAAKRRIDSLAQATKAADAGLTKNVLDTTAALRTVLASKLDKGAVTVASIGALPSADASHKGVFTTGGVQSNGMVRITGSDAAEPAVRIQRTDAPAGNRVWDWTTDKANGSLFLRTIQDDEKGSNWVMKIDRKGMATTSIALIGPTTIDGSLLAKGGMKIPGANEIRFESTKDSNVISQAIADGPGWYFKDAVERDFIVRHKYDDGRILLGAGTGNPLATLAISAKGVTVEGGIIANGKVLAQSAVITDLQVAGSLVTRPTTPWADYVFEPGYQAMPLKEIEAYAKEHKHLPEVPSTADVEKDGIDIAKMNAILLKKVEELTLHAVAQEKQMEALQAEVREMKSAVQAR
ncbi:MAG: hypothetical protein IPO40_08215 [Fibrobacteres bacterium]|nr:hypothetical protein [Fibrobacterota bacterium]